MYNVLVDPVYIKCEQRFFTVKMEPERGVLPSIFAVLWITLIAGSTRASLSGFLYDKR
jgi:hypothetical protein